MGIRGTDFDARICQRDCAGESAKVQESPKVNSVQASAKLVATQGEITAVDGAGTYRRLVDGGAIYPGETVETGPAARGVLAFRDDSRLPLGATTRFRVDSFVFDDKNPGEGKFLVSLLRGTGLDMSCDEACSVFTWLGTIEVTPTNPGQGGGLSALQVLSAGQGLFVSSTGIRALPAPPPGINDLPRPDEVQADTKQLFSSAPMTGGDQEGLDVFVRDGHIEVTTSSETLHLGKGETGFAGTTGQTLRPLLMPLFLEFDRTQRPGIFKRPRTPQESA